jgi:peroxiredoxin family protein
MALDQLELCPTGTDEPEQRLDGLTMVVFSGDLDKMLAAFIIANGAAAMDTPVTMFFTFWGLNVLRRNEPVKVKKSLIDSMFGWMMPRGADKLTLSKMHMAGMGTMMMKRVMQQKHVYSLPKLLETAQEAGVRLVACTMSMDVMGITAEELIDGVDFGGVASFLDAADRSKSTLFI